MKTYAVNLLVDTKNTDIYDKVSLNKFPIIVQCKTEDELKKMLCSDDSISYVKNLIKSYRVFDTSYWYIRTIYKDGNIREIVWKLTDLINIDYL